MPESEFKFPQVDISQLKDELYILEGISHSLIQPSQFSVICDACIYSKIERLDIAFDLFNDSSLPIITATKSPSEILGREELGRIKYEFGFYDQPLNAIARKAAVYIEKPASLFEIINIFVRNLQKQSAPQILEEKSFVLLVIIFPNSRILKIVSKSEITQWEH